MERRPSVGIGVIVIRSDGRVLLYKRKNAHGEGHWGFPGGHLEYGESWEDCAIRETKEETGLDIEVPTFFAVTNDLFPEEKHYITIFMRARHVQGVPILREPDKAESWEWYPWDALPDPLFLPIQNLRLQGVDPLRD